MFYPLVGFKDSELSEVMAELRSDGFEPYLTSVGGSGLGVLSPYHPINISTTASLDPSDTPADSNGDLVANHDMDLLRAAFESKGVLELGGWSENVGRWLFV